MIPTTVKLDDYQFCLVRNLVRAEIEALSNVSGAQAEYDVIILQGVLDQMPTTLEV